jgi:hypothetical protein
MKHALESHFQTVVSIVDGFAAALTLPYRSPRIDPSPSSHTLPVLDVRARLIARIQRPITKKSVNPRNADKVKQRWRSVGIELRPQHTTLWIHVGELFGSANIDIRGIRLDMVVQRRHQAGCHENQAKKEVRGQAECVRPKCRYHAYIILIVINYIHII